MLSTARDILRWHRALAGDRVLSAGARRALFAPRVRVGDGDRAAYGWDLFATPLGPIAAHNGGNGWSFGVIARLPRAPATRQGLVFWISNHAYQAGRWNLERRQSSMTFGLMRRALGQR